MTPADFLPLVEDALRSRFVPFHGGEVLAFVEAR